jgi:hypothetical protein
MQRYGEREDERREVGGGSIGKHIQNILNIRAKKIHS